MKSWLLDQRNDQFKNQGDKPKCKNLAAVILATLCTAVKFSGFDRKRMLEGLKSGFIVVLILFVVGFAKLHKTGLNFYTVCIPQPRCFNVTFEFL